MTFIITLSPVAHLAPLALSRQGYTLTINGEAFDFSALPDGATLPRDAVTCDRLVSDVERIGDVIHLTLILSHGPNAPEATRFPAEITVTANGPVTLPPYDSPTEETEA